MWKWIRVGIIGVVIGLLGGAMYIELGVVRKLYGVGQSMEQIMDVMETDGNGMDGREASGEQDLEAKDQMETAFQVLDASSTDRGETERSFMNLNSYYNSMLALLDEDADGDSGTAEADAKEQEMSDAASDVIRLEVRYSGTEELTEEEEQKLSKCARQAVLYAIAEKLGEDYNEREKSAVRNDLIMSLEMINAGAEEAAEEYGIEAEASSRFEYLYLPETAIGDMTYPAGYYETLCITLK